MTRTEKEATETFERISKTGEINNNDWNFIVFHPWYFNVPMFKRKKRRKRTKKIDLNYILEHCRYSKAQMFVRVKK